MSNVTSCFATSPLYIEHASLHRTLCDEAHMFQQNGKFFRFKCLSGPDQRSCSCGVEVDSEMKFKKSMASVLNSSASSAVLHNSGATAIQTSCHVKPRREERNAYSIFVTNIRLRLTALAFSFNFQQSSIVSFDQKIVCGRYSKAPSDSV